MLYLIIQCSAGHKPSIYVLEGGQIIFEAIQNITPKFDTFKYIYIRK